MKARTWATGLLLGLGGFILGGAARAEDTIKLGLPAHDDAPAVALGKISPDADTIDARYRGGIRVGVYGGYRGYYGGYRGYYGGYRGYYYGGYRGYYGYPYYPRVYVSSYYYPTYYPTPVYYAPPTVYYYPTSTTVISKTMPSADVLNLPYNPPSSILPAPRPMPQDRTFPYDGDPRSVPMPQAEPFPTRVPAPSIVPSPTVPLEGRPVSLPARTTPVKLSYSAYGELPRTPPLAEDRFLPIKK